MIGRVARLPAAELSARPLWRPACLLLSALACLPQVRQALAKVPEEVLSKSYGCGSPLPMGIEGLR